MRLRLELNLAILLLIIFIFSALPVRVSKAEINQPTSYLFYLYYNNSQLTVDRDHTQPFSLSYEPYEATETTTEPTTYRLELLSEQNLVLQVLNFDPVDSRLDFSVAGKDFIQGKIVVAMPFIDRARTAMFYKDKTLLLELNLSNQTGNSVIPRSLLSPSSFPIPPAAASTGYPLFLILGIASVVVAVVVLTAWFIIEHRGKSDNNDVDE